MRWTFDANAGALYVYVRDGRPARQRVLADGVIVDVDESDGIVGIEVLNARTPWDRAAIAERFDLSPDEVAFLNLVAISGVLGVTPTDRGGSVLQANDVPANFHTVAA